MSDTRVPAELGVEIATIARDVTAPIVGFTLNTRDDILTRRGGGGAGGDLRIYQDLARDGHTGSVLRKRRQAVVAREWTVDAGGESSLDERAAMLARATLKRFRFDRACRGLLSAVLTGRAVAEIIWEAAEVALEDGSRGTFIVPADIKVRNARRFVLATDESLRLLTWEAPIDGIPLPDRKFILMRFWAEENEDAYGRGLGHDLFWPVYFKRNAVAVWNALLAKFGEPFIYAEYPNGMPEGDRLKLQATLQDMARGAGLVVPQGTLIKLIEAGAGGSATGRLHQDMTEAMNAEISKIVLGETLTTELGDTGARAATETHEGVRQELADEDAGLLSAEINGTLLTWLTELNLPGAAPPTVWRRAPEAVDLAAMAKLDESLFKVGFEPTEELVKERYGDGYRRIAKPAPVPRVVPPGANPPTPPEPDFAESGDPSAVTDRLADRIERDAAGAQAAMLAAVRQEVESAADFADLEQRLLRLSAAMPVGRLAEALTPALMVAHLAGRSDVQDENAGSP